MLAIHSPSRNDVRSVLVKIVFVHYATEVQSCAQGDESPDTTGGTLDIAVHGRMCGAVSLVPTCVQEGVNRGYLTMHVVREMNICVNDLGCVQATIFARPENCWHATR